jgi:hypothetical protein
MENYTVTCAVPEETPVFYNDIATTQAFAYSTNTNVHPASLGGYDDTAAFSDPHPAAMVPQASDDEPTTVIATTPAAPPPEHDDNGPVTNITQLAATAAKGPEMNAGNAKMVLGMMGNELLNTGHEGYTTRDIFEELAENLTEIERRHRDDDNGEVETLAADLALRRAHRQLDELLAGSAETTDWSHLGPSYFNIDDDLSPPPLPDYHHDFDDFPAPSESVLFANTLDRPPLFNDNNDLSPPPSPEYHYDHDDFPAVPESPTVVASPPPPPPPPPPNGTGSGRSSSSMDKPPPIEVDHQKNIHNFDRGTLRQTGINTTEYKKASPRKTGNPLGDEIAEAMDKRRSAMDDESETSDNERDPWPDDDDDTPLGRRVTARASTQRLYWLG